MWHGVDETKVIVHPVAHPLLHRVLRAHRTVAWEFRWF